MNIVYSLPVYWPAVGGCEFLTHELAHILSEREGVDVRVLTQINDQEVKTRAPLWFNTTCFGEEKGRVYREDGVEVHLLGLGASVRKAIYPFVRYHHRFPRISTRVLIQVFQRQFSRASGDVDIIHCIHNGLSYYGVLSHQVARKSGVPFVFSPTLHLYHEGWHDEMMRAIREGREFRYLPELHLRPRGYHDRFWLQLCRDADALVTWTGFEKDFLVGLGIPAGKIFPLRLGPVVCDEGAGSDLSESYGLEDDVPAVLFLGRNHELKGIEELLQAARTVWTRIPDARFLFIGPKEGKSDDLFRKYRDERVIVIDKVSDGEKVDFIRRCDIFCVPSLHESFGIVFLEAWHHGKPIVAADIPPIRELNPGQRGGFLITPTPEEIAEHIIRLLEDQTLRTRMGEWGKRRVETEYRWDKAADRLLEIYGGLIAGERGGGR
jgi:glycosyltransferase involved in cell wall biosynthesis